MSPWAASSSDASLTKPRFQTDSKEVVTKEVFEVYAATLQPIDIDAGNSLFELDENGCSTGGCPIR